MSKSVNLERARVVEFDRTTVVPGFRMGTYRISVMRAAPGKGFYEVARNGERVEPDIGYRWSETEIRNFGTDIEVLAEFPPTLADVLPEGCQRFEFHNTTGTTRSYARLESNGFWSVSDDSMGEIWRLEHLTEQFNINLNTVVPLVIHPDYIEERR